jgi:hypothetical protein
MTWVLILIGQIVNGGGMVSIPGYASLDACQTAGKAAEMRDFSVQVEWRCIPGPEVSYGFPTVSTTSWSKR